MGKILIALLRAIGRYVADLQRRSRALTAFFHLRMRWVALAWVAGMSVLAGLKIGTPIVPVNNAVDLAQLALPYLLVILAPIAGYWIAIEAFARGRNSPQPSHHLAPVGHWRTMPLREAMRSKLFGPAGFMASLLAGMLLNVVVRTGEYMLAVPALNAHAPAWGEALFLAMTLDVVTMNFFYVVCFVMALRSVPLFPRMLLFAWTLDILLQLAIARTMSGFAMPGEVAGALGSLLEGNMQKVLISVAVWLPYLILSKRVNLTYRRRAPASGPVVTPD